MASITILFKDGTTREFPHQGRAGGSYTKTLSYKEGAAIVEDEWDNKTVFPIADIKEIKVKSNSGW